MTQVEFLEARIAEDEAVADRVHDVSCPACGTDRRCFCVIPARVLAECEAKRRIVADRVRIDRSANDDEWSMGYSDANYSAMHALATVYADHPDYLPEWRV